MDEFVKTNLTKIKCEKYIPKFEANEIDEFAFMLLTPDNLRELLPYKMGPQIKIMNLIRKLQYSPEITTTNGNESSGESPRTNTSSQCQKCTMKFQTAAQLLEHLKLIHRESRYCTKFTCPTCKSECQIQIKI